MQEVNVGLLMVLKLQALVIDANATESNDLK